MSKTLEYDGCSLFCRMRDYCFVVWMLPFDFLLDGIRPDDKIFLLCAFIFSLSLYSPYMNVVLQNGCIVIQLVNSSWTISSTIRRKKSIPHQQCSTIKKRSRAHSNCKKREYLWAFCIQNLLLYNKMEQSSTEKPRAELKQKMKW